MSGNGKVDGLFSKIFINLGRSLTGYVHWDFLKSFAAFISSKLNI